MADDNEPRGGESTGDPALEPRALASRLLNRTRATVHYLVGGDPDADDIVQLALIEILHSVHSFRGESRLETWADRITVRTALRAVGRRRRRQAPLAGPPEEEPQPAEVEPDPQQVQALRRARLRRRLAEHLQQLVPQRRAVVLLRFVHGYSIEEISAITETRVNTVRDRLRVGKQELRRALLEDAWLREEFALHRGASEGREQGEFRLHPGAPAGREDRNSISSVCASYSPKRTPSRDR